MKIKEIKAYEIITSNGYPTIEVSMTSELGSVGVASVPYGLSAGSHEASILLDEEKRYNGKGSRKAVKNVLEIIMPELIGKNLSNQKELDKILLELDRTSDKSNLGGNTILAVSLAFAKTYAAEERQPLYRYLQQSFNIQESTSLPNPMMVSIEGGKHAYKSTDLQEYCLSGLSDEGPAENIRKCLETYHKLGELLRQNNFSTNVGNEGAYAPDEIESNEAPLEYLVQAIKQAGYNPGKDIGISIDAAASEFYKDGQYFLTLEDQKFSSDELIKYYEPWLIKYPIITIEDMLHEDDWQAWTKLTEISNSHNILNIGDDLTATNKERLQKAIDQKAISAILIKLNQIGSVTETIEACLLAKEHGMDTIPSHRGGGETTDTSMIDLAVAVGSKFVKVGPTRGERVIKYNRLMEIEREVKI